MDLSVVIHIEDNKSILIAYRNTVEDHVYWSESADYNNLLEEFYSENPEYKNCEVTLYAE